MAASGLAFYAFAFEAVVARRYRSRMERERRALYEVVGLVREVEQAQSIDEDWSPLQRAEFRIRLSRFDA